MARHGRKHALQRIRDRRRRIIDRVRNLRDRWFDSKGAMIPPRSIDFVGGHFLGIGEGFRHHFVELAGLRPDDHLLDVGCGIGRMAVPLTDYLSPAAQYRGFDIVRAGIDWCAERITTRFPNFHFRHADIYNKTYNPKGTTQARDFRFPYADETFDVVVLTSVFTHMLPPDLENYLREIARVLKAGGRCLITFFLLNQESEELLHSGASTIDFRYQVDGCLTSNESQPEAAIAYPEDRVRALFAEDGLRIVEPIHYGSWCGRDRFFDSQDIVVALKG